MIASQFPRLTVDGSPVRPAVAASLVDAVVDDDLYLPDMFELRFADPQRTLSEQMPFHIGAVVEIHTGRLGEDQSALLINGEVTAIEAVLDSTGSFLCITGYDQSHRLHRGRRTATFNDTTDSKLVERIAKSAGVPLGTIDPTTDTLAHVSQVNETDWNFLLSRARQAGRRLFVKEGNLHYRAGAAPDPRTPPEMRYGRELLEFRARMTANEQVAAVEVRGWDYETKTSISEKLDTVVASATLGGSSIKADTIDSTFGASTFVVTDVAIGRDVDARVAVNGLQVDMSSAQLYATGTVVGDPRVTADAAIMVSGTGQAFDGRWVVSHSRHVFDRLGYTTHFTVSGSQDRSLAGLISGLGGGAATGATPRFEGVVTGIVTDTNDPAKIGRVKVKLSWLAEDFVTSWVRVCYPGAGDKRGWFACPELHDEVLIAFAHGDVSEPYVIGSLYNGKDKPRNATYASPNDGAVIRRSWMSRKGHGIEIVEDPQKADDDVINVVTAKGVRVSVQDNGTVTIGGKKALIDVSDTFEISADGDVKINGKNITINATAALTMTATKGAKLDGGSQTEIKGGTVKLNS